MNRETAPHSTDSKRLVQLALMVFSLVCPSPDFPSTSAADEAQNSPAFGTEQLEPDFEKLVRPFLKSHCLDCHGTEVQEAKLDLSTYTSGKDIAQSHQSWEIILKRLEAGEMPPPEAVPQPSAQHRQDVIHWIKAIREAEASRNAGDPGPVLARRLSNAEYNYSIRDLTGADIRPTDTFPVDPANEAGFDNSGESLTMSPALLRKYLDAARHVVEHLALTPDGIAFAPHPVVTDTDRDKYCVNRIVQFYQQQPTDLADYFYAAWQYRCRSQSANVSVSLDNIAAEQRVSPKYLATVWDWLTSSRHSVGAITNLRAKWNNLPLDEQQTSDTRLQCEQLRDEVQRLRSKLVPKFDSLYIEGNHKGSQPFVLWKNRQYAASRRTYDHNALIVQATTSQGSTDDSRPDPIDMDLLVPAAKSELRRYEAAFEEFCSVFPDTFYVSERGRDYVNDSQKQDGEKGRLLSAGFHSMMGYFRDDAPLYDLILTEAQQQQLDSLWQQLDFITSAPMRQYVGFLWFERTDSRFMRDAEFDFARAENKAAQSEPMISRLAEVYLKKAEKNGGGALELEAIRHFFKQINQQIRWVETTRIAAEAAHLQAVLNFAERAWRRSLSQNEREELLVFYRSLREMDQLTHEEALQDTVVSVLMSPNFCYLTYTPKTNQSANHSETQNVREQLTDFELASRLSYFLWSSIPDAELLQHAAAGHLHQAEILVAQTQRMLQNEKVTGLATEFGGNWLDFRRFKEHNSVDRERFPEFTDELRAAMFEEPIRFFVDLIQQNRPVTEFLDAKHTFVNKVLARHYDLPETVAVNDEWTRIDNANQYGRGGLLPMAVFLTKNSPGLRTSPVKRGYWVVRRLLGEHIPPPPPNVPELPDDEAQTGELTLRDALARHREHKSCAGCHNRIDSIGLVFEGYGPVGERRAKDLGGRPVETSATLPNGQQATGLSELRTYLHEHRQQEIIDNFSRKLLSYALGRTLILSDDLLVRELQEKMQASDNRFGSLIEGIVTSPQFLHKRSSRGMAGIPSSDTRQSAIVVTPAEIPEP